MSEMKYKVGDEVVVVGNNFKSTKDMIGYVGKVLEVNENSIKFQYSIGNDDKKYWFAESELELVKNIKGTYLKCIGGAFSLVDVVNIGDIIIIKDVSFEDGKTNVTCCSTENLEEFTIPFELLCCGDRFVEVVAPNNTTKKVKSDGGSSSYYFSKLPKPIIDEIVEKGGIEIKDIVKYCFYNDADCKDIIKALKRIMEDLRGGGKEGVDAYYDSNKIEFFVNEMKSTIKVVKEQGWKLHERN